MHWLYHAIRHFLLAWGYWAVFAGIFGESAGIPLPGESVLMFSSFLAHKQHALNIYWVMVVGIAGATMGDNLGYWIGRYFGRGLGRWMRKLFHLSDTDFGAAKDQMTRRGAVTIFFARFIFGLRTIAGPMAGILGMRWGKFALFNFLGAATWVTAMAWIGYAFANEFQTLLDYIEKVSWGFAGVVFVLGYWLWHRQKKHYKQRANGTEKA